MGHNPTEIPGQINHFVGISAVANDVAKIPDDIILRSSGKDGLESWQIGMDVRDDRSAHLSSSV